MSKSFVNSQIMFNKPCPCDIKMKFNLSLDNLSYAVMVLCFELKNCIQICSSIENPSEIPIIKSKKPEIPIIKSKKLNRTILVTECFFNLFLDVSPI